MVSGGGTLGTGGAPAASGEAPGAGGGSVGADGAVYGRGSVPDGVGAPWAGEASALRRGMRPVPSTSRESSCQRWRSSVIQAQLQRTREELNRNPVLGKSLVKRATLFVQHIGEYRQQRKAAPAVILKELLGP